MVAADFDWGALEGIDWDEIKEKNLTEIVAERFPAFKWALDNPELGKLLRQAIDEEWTPETFEANFRASEWYTGRTETERAFDIREESDPTSAQSEVDQRFAELQDLATRTFGDSFADDGLLRDLARRAVRSGASEDEIMGILVANASDTQTPGEVGGDLAATHTNIQAMAASYMTTVTDEQVANWANQMLTGELTEDGLRAIFKEKAISRFPSLAEIIEQGAVPADYFSDHQSTVANMMGLGVDEVDFLNDERWLPILGFADDTGKIRPMTAAETAQYVRTTDSFQSTEQGRAEASSIKRGITQALGVA